MFLTKLTTVLVAAVFLCASIGSTQAQENIQLQIPPSLVECYNTSYFMNRDNRLPANINTLISLIEKVEFSYGYNQDIRQLAVSLLHRFRQDGIQRAPGVNAAPGIIPFSPTGFQFPKFRILLGSLIPGNALQFPNDTLTREERCSLHFMLSSSFETQVRGDENRVCNSLSQYRAERLPRSLPRTERSNFLGDVEIFDEMAKRAKKRGARPSYNNNKGNYADYDMEADWTYAPNGDASISQCPVENGVIRTRWGSVAAGTVIAGIATGLTQQSVQLRVLLALARRSGSLPQTAQVNIDNRWAATLAGDLAEVALVQVPVSPTNTASVGANGAWNSTVLPRWYFLSQRQNLEMTDAEIRGGLDGLIMAMNVYNWRNQASSLRLSQLLRMYYSTTGVLDTGIMACNRNDNFPKYAPPQDMITQTSAFAQVLDREMQLRVTLNANAITNFSTEASRALISYVPQYLNDLSCTASNALPQDISESTTPITNIFVYLDTSWQYQTVVDYVIYVLQELNIHPYASSVTLLSASNANVIVNTTNYLTDVDQGWNVTTHATFVPGFDLPEIMRSLQNITQNLMNGERTNSSVGGRSLVALLIPNQAMLSDAQSSFSTTQFQYMAEQIPDLRFIYYGGGSIQRFSSYVSNPNQDLFNLNTGATPAVSSAPVANRISRIPRRIINPRCGSQWVTPNWGTDQMTQYVRPGTINFYRLASNYFFGNGNGRFVNIQAQNTAQLTVCASRVVELPTQNSSTSQSSGDIQCTQIQSNTFSYDLSSACNGYPRINACPPLYLSVQAAAASAGGSLTVSCNNNACQTPDQLSYIVSVVNLDCYSGVARLATSVMTLLLAYILRSTLQ